MGALVGGRSGGVFFGRVERRGVACAGWACRVVGQAKLLEDVPRERWVFDCAEDAQPATALQALEYVGRERSA